jgi:hypothetical protein
MRTRWIRIHNTVFFCYKIDTRDTLAGVPDVEHGAEHPRDGRAAVPRHEDDDDALAAPVHPHEDVRAGAGRPRQVPRPRAQRARQLLHGLRGGGETLK